jgi:hypothetical protein
MTRGRTSRILSPADRARLRRFQSEHAKRLGVSVGLPQLKLAMEAPFTWEVLQRALAGYPVWECYHEFIVTFLAKYVPHGQVVVRPVPPGFPMTRQSRNEYMRSYQKERRARLLLEGTCVDCQQRSAHQNPKTGKKHTLCAECLTARRERLSAAKRQLSLALAATEEMTI